MRMVRVLRGGSWYSLQVLARCSCRYWDFPDNYWYFIGVRVSFRLIRSAP